MPNFTTPLEKKNGEKNNSPLQGGCSDGFKPGNAQSASRCLQSSPVGWNGRSFDQGALKGAYLKLSNGAQCAKQSFYREMDCPVQRSLATPSALEKSVQSQPGLSSRKSHLQVQMPQGRLLAREAPSNKGPKLGLPHLRVSLTIRNKMITDRHKLLVN